jgi:hypothetical protein
MRGAVYEIRLGELLAALSLATDLGNGFSLEKALRNCLLATRLMARAHEESLLANVDTIAGS